jgi:hypothetical protein
MKARKTTSSFSKREKRPVLGRTSDADEPILILSRASEEGVRSPGDIVSLLEAGGFVTGRIVGRNPVTHDQWWVTGISVAKTGVPYVVALGAVLRTWLKERKGRRIKLETKSVKISANNVKEVELILKKLAKYEKVESIQVTKALALKAARANNALGKKKALRKSSSLTLEKAWQLLTKMAVKAAKIKEKELSQDASEAIKLLEQLGDELHLTEIENAERSWPQIIG